MTIDTKTDRLIDSFAAACVEQLLDSTRKEGGKPWFFIVHVQMEKLLKEYERVRGD